MRIRYLRIALLVSVLAATAAADTTRTNIKSATSRGERSSPSDRNGVAAIGASASNEDRVRPFRLKEMPARRFVEEVLLNNHTFNQKAVEKVSNRYSKMVADGLLPSLLYKKMVRNVPMGKMLASTQWRTWAYFASKYSAHIGKNPHEYIVEVMWNQYGAGQFSEILAAAAGKYMTGNLVEKLQEVQISLWLKRRYQPQVVFHLLQVEDVWEKNIFANPRFVTWTRYLERVHKLAYEKDPIRTEIRGLREFIQYGSLLKLPLLPKNSVHSKSAQYTRVLKSIGLEDGIIPCHIVSMLLEGVKEGIDQFSVLFMYGPVRNFWIIYATEFNMRYPHLEASLFQTLASFIGLPKLMTMLHDAVMASDEKVSGMALLYLEFLFLEWKTSKVKAFTDVEPGLTSVPRENGPTIIAIWLAYLKYCKEENRLIEREDFIIYG